MYIQRKLEGTILKHLRAPEIIAITGPRQSGKTTLLLHLLHDLPKTRILSFDDQETLTLFERHPKDFIAAHVEGNDYLFIDEFQYAKGGGKILKLITDHHRIKIFITGSSSIDITVQAVKYLVGRIFVFTLYPLDFQEFVSAKDASAQKLFHAALKRHISPLAHKILSELFEEYLLYGGYPRVVTESHTETKKIILRNIYNTYFLREVRDILGLIDDYKLQTLIKGLAVQIGDLIEYSELSRLSTFSYTSLKKYLNFLEKTYITTFVRPYYKNKRTEIVKNPKIYFLDTGFRNSVANDFRKLHERPDGGALFENGLAMEFIKHEAELNFWRDKKRHEVDFVITQEGGMRRAIESKLYARKKDIESMKVFHAFYPTIPRILAYFDCEESTKDEAEFLPSYLVK